MLRSTSFARRTGGGALLPLPGSWRLFWLSMPAPESSRAVRNRRMLAASPRGEVEISCRVRVVVRGFFATGHIHGRPRHQRAGSAGVRLRRAAARRGRQGHRRPDATWSSASSSACSPAATCCSRACPGLAKTLTVKTLCDALHAKFQRIQFTPDLLPADLIGTVIYNQQTRRVHAPSSARSSPTWCSPTRSTARPPRCRAALLEAMQERQVTIGDDDPPRCPTRSSSWRRRTRSSRRAPTRCPRRSSTASC